MAQIFKLALISMVLSIAHSMIMRNNALMSKMVSRFQSKENNRPHERKHSKQSQPNEESTQEGTPERVLSLMQNVLCKNFPTVPCKLITKDETLRNLIEKSIQQLKYKKLAISMERSTTPPNQLTLFPVITNEDLSNFLSVSNTGFFKQKKRKKSQKKNSKNNWSHEKRNKSKKAVFGHKKIRKFYPHKVKYKDKHDKGDFHDYSGEKLSMSVELPGEHSPSLKRSHFSYQSDPSDPPVWRIDYMKHGEPSLNMFGYESDSLKGKIMKTGPNVIVDENFLERAARRDVLHPDVYIKNKYSGKNNEYKP